VIRALRGSLRAEVRFQLGYVTVLAAVLGVLYALSDDGEAIGADIDTDGAPSPT
jgi:hypothetical protein